MASPLTIQHGRSVERGAYKPSRSLAELRPVAVSNLAGQSPHIRVQYESGGEWHLYATFREVESADTCARRLSYSGYRVRLISFSIAPAAG